MPKHNGDTIGEAEERELDFIKRLFDAFRGKTDIKTKLTPLVDPDKIQTMSVLNLSQVKYVSDSYFLAKTYPLFGALQRHANELMFTAPSKGGLGREQAIRFMGALSESKMLSKLGLTVSGDEKK